MLHRFQRYCATHSLCRNDSKWLLAVSGGVDSMVLAHLCWSAKMQIGIAHCNFSLRGKESDADEIFVKHWAQERQIPFYTITFDTKKYAAEKGISTQMAARDLRYAWFEEIRAAQKYTDIAVAHHTDDNVETLLINLTRSTGLKGLCGMQPVNGCIIRPLLFATRDEIMAYASANAVNYHEDATNAATDYARNRIRHRVIPELKVINPSVIDSITHTAHHLSQAYQVIVDEREKNRKKLLTYINQEVHISIKALDALPYKNFWLFELLQPYHFSGNVVNKIITSLEGQSGKRFYSPTHELVKDRESLVIVPLTLIEDRDEEFLIDENRRSVSWPISLCFTRENNREGFLLQRTRDTACLAADKLVFPLKLRRWKDGDMFMPLGMSGKKKVSDFLIDEKVPLHEKAQQYVLLSENKIVWVIGRRIDERYKVITNTKNILLVAK